MLEEILKDLRDSIARAHDALKKHLATVRTGRAHAGLFDAVRVDYYGTPTPIAQMATVSVPDARLVVIKPWDKTAVRTVEKAIREGDLGFNPQVDGDIIRVPIPTLTEERRKEMVKLTRKYAEECKVAIRKARHDAIDLCHGAERDGEASADDVDRAKKKLEDLVAEGTKQVDTIIAHKEKDILEI